ncbi:DUF7344 domain-containing protein [Halosegnis longus]|uniref:DUF7344 domain-containing protein n=1 Tax=Halosegnis longus TaxID=2216012 RepID=UPI00096A5E76|nr:MULTISPECIES: hypothetical protein [Halobacteriales]
MTQVGAQISEDVQRDELTTDAVFETLSSRRRRYALHYLTHTGGETTTRALSEQIAAWENGIEREAVVPKQRKRVYTALHQTHLPKMAKLGVVEYDRNRGTISLTRTTDEFDIYLDVVPSNDLPWSEVYLGVGAVLLALSVVAAVGVPPFGMLPGFAYAIGTAMLLALLGLYNTVRDRRLLIGTTKVTTGPCPPPAEAIGLSYEDTEQIEAFTPQD